MNVPLNFVPLNDRVVVKRLGSKDQTDTGLFIPVNSQEKSMQGLVAAVGRGRLTSNGVLIEPTVKPTDHILFAKHAGTEVKIGDEAYLIMREEDILGIIEHEDATV